MQIGKLIISSFKKRRSDIFHARIQESSSGGVGSRSIWQIKKALTTFFFLFNPQLILQKSGGNFQKNYHLPRFEWSGTFSRWSPIFSRGGGGVKLLFTYRNPYNL